ncbi:MAG: tRNA-intron lyase [Candidatus Lokiarchaeota archaeon]|nr:tRNA-intron lyase [Candidatus Lokiarchaeota archaeon]
MDTKPEIVPTAKFTVDRAVVWKPEDGMYLYGNGYFGQPVGIRKPKSPEFEKPLELSLIECAYLMKEKRLKVLSVKSSVEMTLEEVIHAGLEIDKEFNERLKVYTELRSRGYIVRPGLKFGTDFSVYEKGPGIDHAPFLVHVIPQRVGVEPLDIVRAGRLATSVRKKFLIATIKDNGQIVYYSFVWHRP